MTEKDEEPQKERVRLEKELQGCIDLLLTGLGLKAEEIIGIRTPQLRRRETAYASLEINVDRGTANKLRGLFSNLREISGQIRLIHRDYEERDPRTRDMPRDKQPYLIEIIPFKVDNIRELLRISTEMVHYLATTLNNPYRPRKKHRKTG